MLSLKTRCLLLSANCHFGALDIAARQVGCRSSSSAVNGRSYRSCLGVRQGELEVFDCVVEVLFTAALSLGVEVGFFVCLGHSVTQDRVRSITRKAVSYTHLTLPTICSV